MNKVIRCIVVGDHPAMCLALRMTLTNAGMEVVAESARGDDVLKQISGLNPDIVLLDLDLSVIDGFELLKRLVRHDERSRIIALTAVDNEHLAARVKIVGAHGYLHKSVSLEQLPQVIRLVHSGYSYFSDKALAISAKYHGGRDGEFVLSCLSKRELTVFLLLAKGANNSQIAGKLALSPQTISTYKTRIYGKLKINSLVELIEVAQHAGL